MRNIIVTITLFQSFTTVYVRAQGRRASRLPLAIIFRAFGAPETVSDFGRKAKLSQIFLSLFADFSVTVSSNEVRHILI